MTSKNHWTRRILLVIILLISILFLVSCSTKNDRFELRTMQGQVGLFSDKLVPVSFENQAIELYKTVDEDIFLIFDVLDVDKNHQNKIMINDDFIMPLRFEGYHGQYKTVQYKLLGLHVQNGNMIVSIQTGANDLGHLDTFHVRNVTLKVGSDIFWSHEYPKDEYLNETLKIGSSQLTSNYRFGYTPQRTFTFQLPEEKMKGYGYLFAEEKASYALTKGKDQVVLDHLGFMDLSVNIEDHAHLTESFILDVNVSNAIQTEVFMDGIQIQQGLSFDKSAWSEGSHHLFIVSTNDKGYVKTFDRTFTLAPVSETFVASTDVKTFDYGVIRSETNHKNEVVWTQETPLQASFGKLSSTSFQSTANNERSIIRYEGSTLPNRTAYLQIFNHKTFAYDTVSTYFAIDETPFYLGFNYGNFKDLYVKYDKVDWRVVSENTTPMKLAETYLYHVTDIQYMTQKLYQASGTVLGDEAEEAYANMVSYMLQSYQQNRVLYTMMTGDFTQTLRNTHQEYQKVMTHFFNPLFDANYPFGVLAGNHDIGAVSENLNGGGQALDPYLTYDVFGTYLGADKFEKYSFFGGATANNKSHYDRIYLGNTIYTMIYIGWGSTLPGLNVSSVDIQYAQSVINLFPNDPVILLTHNYMGNAGLRSGTGATLYASLVLPNPQVKMVLSGHINGSSSRIDLVDDNNDGLMDREIIQVLTNFQEEENLYGASFIRRLGLDFENRRLIFDLYSPFFNDYDVFVNDKKDFVGDHKAFYIDFDIEQNGYGLISYRVMD